MTNYNNFTQTTTPICPWDIFSGQEYCGPRRKIKFWYKSKLILLVEYPPEFLPGYAQ